MDRDLAALHPAQHVAQGRQVEDVGQALAVGLDEDREASVAAGHGEQVRGALALLPERRARSRPAPGQEQGPGRVLAEAGREERGPADGRDHQVLHAVGIREELVLDPLEVAVRQADGDAVVRPDAGHLGAQPLAQARLDRHRPRRVDAAAERREQDQPPVAELVPEPLHDDPAIGRQGAGRLALVLEVGDEVLGRQRVEVMAFSQARQRARPPLRPAGQIALHLAHEGAQRAAQLDRAADRVALPERELARLARGGLHDHAVRSDLGDSPAACPEDDHVAVHPGPQLVDHLLVQLAHPPARRARPRRPRRRRTGRGRESCPPR